MVLQDESPQRNSLESSDDDEERTNKYDKAGKLRKMKHEQAGNSESLGSNIRTLVILAVLMMLMMFTVHCTWVTSNAYSSPSIVLASYGQDGSRQILDDFREAYYWLSQNTPDQSRVMSWWDYGYQIAGQFSTILFPRCEKFSYICIPAPSKMTAKFTA